MKLTIVIVNYNVRYFLEQCLRSVEKAMQGLSVEVYVVDNQSVDGSMLMVEEKFPWAIRIANKENVGFSRANNQAMRVAKGEYVLLLNPDTVIEEDTLRKVIDFMDTHPDAGGLGVDMVDGKGRFLPESKRGLPTPATSFYKIFGISKLFPRSARFNNYHLGHLSRHETHQVEILSGAFMLMRKKALDQVGLLDEAFFMYGEDIDLSWRIIQGGWKNYYYPGTRIIHYKGESTKKGSLNYVYVFYNAMVIFARKHFSEKNAKLFSFFIQLAIWLRAGAAVLARGLKAIALPFCDVLLTLAGWWALKNYYAIWQQKVYDDTLVWTVFSATTAIYVFSVWLNGGYDKPWRYSTALRPISGAAVLIVAAYSLLPEDMRFSRALILGGAVVALLVFIFNRFFTKKIHGVKSDTAHRFAVVGSEEETLRVQQILEQTQFQPSLIERVSHNTHVPSGFVGSVDQLEEIVRIHHIDQLIFCAKDVSSSAIISAMSGLGSKEIEFKIAPPETMYIIGSNSIETSGDVFMLDVNSISKPVNRRRKRVFDIVSAAVVLILSPILIFAQKKPLYLLPNVLSVLVGKKTWVGFIPVKESGQLPGIKSGIIHPGVGDQLATTRAENAMKLNVLYAKDYKVSNDLRLLLRGLRDLGS